MSAPGKLRDRKSELTRFKLKWKSLSEEARSPWRALFGSEVTQAEIRQRIADEFQIDLRYDKQLTRFRQWLNEEAEKAWMAAEERRLTELFLNSHSKAEIREIEVSRKTLPKPACFPPKYILAI